MNKTAFIAVAVLASLLAGGLVALVSAGDSAEPAGDAPLAVPAGRVGDVVQYATYARTETDDAWTPMSTWAFKVEGARQALDQTMRPRSAIDVVWAGTGGDFTWQPYAEIVEWSGNWTSVSNVALDLETRSVVQVRWEFLDASAPPIIPAVEDSLGFSDVYYGPEFPGTFPWPHWFMGQVPAFFAVQGTEYKPGQAMSPDGLHLLDGEWVAHLGAGSSFDVASEVTEATMIEGNRTVSLRTSACGTIAIPTSFASWYGTRSLAELHGVDNPDPEAHVGFLHTYVPRNTDLCFQVDMWVTEGNPYPILYEETVQVDGEPVASWAEALVSLTPGDEPIGWSTSGAPSGPSVGVEWSEGATPSDGSEYRFAVSADEALAAVLDDESLTEFQEWRRAGEPAYLLGGHLANGGCFRAGVSLDEQKLQAWDFLFGKTAGEYFYVRSHAPVAGDLRVENCALRADEGLNAPPSFDAGTLPVRSVTVSYIDLLFRSIHGDADPAAMYAGWGWTVWCRSEEVAAATFCSQAETVIVPGPWERFGQVGVFDCQDPTCMTPGFDMDYVWVDLETGHLVTSSRWTSEPRTTAPFSLQPTGLEPPGYAMVASGGSGAPPVVVLAVGGTVLAVALLLYFLPLIRYGTSLVPFLVPGYAKLRKDKVLDNALREEILDQIRTDPGVSPPEIHQAVGAGWSTVVYHLGVLQKNGLVSSLLDGRHKRFFPTDSVDWTRRGELAALKNDRTKQIYQILLAEPGLGRRDLAKRVGVTPNAIDWHIERLEAVSLAGVDKDGRPHRIYAIPTTAATLPQGIEVA